MTESETILIVTGDDFGISPAVNAAIIRAHSEGILTSASLLVNGSAFHEAATLAKQHPRLGVGIHISLLRGKALLSPAELPPIVDRAGNFPEAPVSAGFKYFFDRRVRGPMEKEIEAQIRRFLDTGLTPTHIDGHLHIHVHPVILDILLKLAVKYSVPAFRLPRDSLGVNLKVDRRNLWLKSLYAIIYGALCTYASKRMQDKGILFPNRFFGLLASGHMKESYLLALIEGLEPGVTEIGMHPALSPPAEVKRWVPDYEFASELRALLSPKVKEKIRSRGIRLANYRTLAACSSKLDLR
ncbi:MAG: hopanoid biosynthesis-associated protein HpnK [Deltaproteobacteria bacterium]